MFQIILLINFPLFYKLNYYTILSLIILSYNALLAIFNSHCNNSNKYYFFISSNPKYSKITIFILPFHNVSTSYIYLSLVLNYVLVCLLNICACLEVVQKVNNLIIFHIYVFLLFFMLFSAIEFITSTYFLYEYLPTYEFLQFISIIFVIAYIIYSIRLHTLIHILDASRDNLVCHNPSDAS